MLRTASNVGTKILVIICTFYVLLNWCFGFHKISFLQPAQSTKADGESRQDASSSKSSNSKFLLLELVVFNSNVLFALL